MRELYLVESLIHIIYLPFKIDYKLEDVRVKDPIVNVCNKTYKLIKNIGYLYY